MDNMMRESKKRNGTHLTLSTESTSLEEVLRSAWSQVLGANVGLEDNFFDLGGDSLKVIDLRRQLSAMGIRLQMPDVFRFPNVRALADHLAAA